MVGAPSVQESRREVTAPKVLHSAHQCASARTQRPRPPAQPVPGGAARGFPGRRAGAGRPRAGRCGGSRAEQVTARPGPSQSLLLKPPGLPVPPVTQPCPARGPRRLALSGVGNVAGPPAASSRRAWPPSPQGPAPRPPSPRRRGPSSRGLAAGRSGRGGPDGPRDPRPPGAASAPPPTCGLWPILCSGVNLMPSGPRLPTRFSFVLLCPSDLSAGVSLSPARANVSSLKFLRCVPRSLSLGALGPQFPPRAVSLPCQPVPTGDFLKISVPLLNKSVNLFFFSIYTRSLDEFIQSHRLKTLLNANEPQKCVSSPDPHPPPTPLRTSDLHTHHGSAHICAWMSKARPVIPSNLFLPHFYPPHYWKPFSRLSRP